MAKFDIKAYIENNRQQAMIFGAVGVVVLLLLGYGVSRMMGGGGSPDELAAEPGTAGGGFAGSPTPAGGPPMPGAPSGTAGGPPMPGMPSGSPSGAPTPTGGPMPEPSASGAPSPGPSSLDSSSLSSQSLDGSAVPAAKKAKKDAGPPSFTARMDPFAPHGMKSPAEMRRLREKWIAQQKEAALIAQMNQLPSISIYRAKGAVADNNAVAPTQTPETVVVRRTAGLLYGDRVLGVLETDGKTSVVKPGDVLTSGTDRVKVTSIDRNGIVLKRLDNKKSGISNTIRVPLKNAPEGSVTSPGMPRGGMPYGPGGMRGGPPMPGMPRAGGPPLPEG